MTINASETTKHAVDLLSVVTVLGTLVDFLPAVAAGLSIVWSIIRIWETDTVQNFLNKWRKS
jgi:hypothetical protein